MAEMKHRSQFATPMFSSVWFRYVELPDNFDCLGVINKYTLNCIIQMLSEFVIGQAGHPACCFMLFFCIKTLLMKDLKLSLTRFQAALSGRLLFCARASLPDRYSSGVSFPSR